MWTHIGLDEMKTFLDCMPCLLRQAIDAARMATDDDAIHEQVVCEALAQLRAMDFSQPPLSISRSVHRVVRELTGNDDPYREVKERFNRFALKLYPQLKNEIQGSVRPWETAIRLAIAGNIIDYGPNGELDETYVLEVIKQSLFAPLSQHSLSDFKRSVEQARTILYLADNAGEIVFDRLLIEQLPLEKVTVAVKGRPVINDATMEDAQEAGLTDLVEVVDNGSDAPGTIMELCSKQFQRRFQDADLVVAKGQGNYETLNDTGKDVFYLFKVKCSVIARQLGCKVGALILTGNRQGYQF